MAVSQNTQRGLYADHANEVHFVKTADECESLKGEMRATGRFKKVSHSVINDGTRERPRYEFKVMGWAK